MQTEEDSAHRDLYMEIGTWDNEIYDFEDENCGEIKKVLVEGNNLFVFTENKLIQFLVAGWNKILKPNEIFRFDKTKELRDLKIEEILFKPECNMFYIISERNKKDKKILVRIDYKSEKPNNSKIVKEIGLNGHSFEVHHSAPNLVYFIEENVIYVFDLEGESGGLSNLFSGFGFGGKKEGKDLFGAAEFFPAKKTLRFVKFDKTCENFYCNDDRIIKKYSVEQKEVVDIFDDLAAETNDVLLDEKKKLLFSFDPSGEVKIWSLESQRLITKLRKGGSSKVFKHQKLFDSNRLFISLHQKGIDIWQLTAIQKKTILYEQDSNPEMVYLASTNSLVVNISNEKLLILDLNTMEIKDEVKLPENATLVEILENGDVHVIYENKEFDKNKFALDLKMMKVLKSKLPKIIETKSIDGSKIIIDVPSDEENKEAGNFETGAQNDLVFSDVYQEISKPKTMVVSKVRINTNKAGSSQKDAITPDKASNTNLKYMNLSQRDQNREGKVETKYRDDTQVEILKSRAELPQIEDIHDIDNLPLLSKPSLIEKTLAGYQPQEIDKKKFRFYMIRIVLSDIDPVKQEDNWFYLFQTNYEIVSLHTDRRSVNFRAGAAGKVGSVFTVRPDEIAEDGADEGDGLESGGSKFVFETLLFLENQTLQNVSYHTTHNNFPIQEKIYFEKIFDSNKLGLKGAALSNQYSQDGSISSSRNNFKLESNLGESIPVAACHDACFKTSMAVMLAPRPDDIDTGGLQMDGVSSKYMAIGGSLNSSKQILQVQKEDMYVLNVLCQYKKNKPQTLTIDLSGYPDFANSGPLTLKPGKKPSMSGISVYSFYLYSQAHVASFEYRPSTKNFTYFKILKRKTASDTPPAFSPTRSLFFVPVKNKVQIWDDQLQFFLETLQTEKNIESIVVNDDRSALLVYDVYWAYHFDMDTFRLLRRLPATNPADNSFYMPLDPFLLPVGSAFRGVFHHIGGKIPSLSPSREPLDLSIFPFETLKLCYERKNYSDAVRDFSKYYFERLAKWGRQDYAFGPLSPLMMCVFHFDSALLEEILGLYFYPVKTHNYVSPLEFAFIAGHKASIIEVCTNLIKKREESIFFSRADFKFLLVSKLPKAHSVIASMLVDMPSRVIPKVIYLRDSVESRSTEYVTSLGVDIRRKDLQQDAINERLLEAVRKKGKRQGSKYQGPTSKTASKSEIQVLTTPFKYNYDVGTDDSVMFVNRFAYSNSEDFVLSDWKQIITKKWRTMKVPYMVLFLMYMMYVLFITLNFVFLKTNKAVYWIAISFNLLFLVYELIQMIVYSAYKPHLYFSDMYSWIDWIVGIGCLLYQFILHDSPEKQESMVISVLLLLLLYYRFFSFLRIIDSFTTLVGIINIILKKLWVFFLILAFALWTFSVMMIRLDGTESIGSHFTKVFVWVLLAGAEDTSFELKYSHIALVIGSIFVTVVLLNILIAYLSNLFSRLEDAQKLHDLKEKAVLILDLEILVMFFKYKLTGVLSLRQKQEILKSETGARKEDWRMAFKPKARRALEKYQHNEKFFFIFKATDWGTEEDSESENVYQKIKNLEKASEDLSSLILLKNRTLEKSIGEVKETFRKMSSSQSNVMDDLKDVISGNSKEILENTENLIFTLESNDKKTNEKIERLMGLEGQIKEVQEQVAVLSNVLGGLSGGN